MTARLTARPTGKRSGEFFGEGYSFRRLCPPPDDYHGADFQALLRRLYGRMWYAAHREQVLAAMAKARAADLADPVRAAKRRGDDVARVRRYARRHPDRVRARKRKWDSDNRDRRLAYARDYNRRYYAANAERLKAKARARHKGA